MSMLMCNYTYMDILIHIIKNTILITEGNKESHIRKADGEAEAIKRVTDAEKYQKLIVADSKALAIKKVHAAIHNGNPTNDLIAIKYLESLKDIAFGQATNTSLPIKASGSLGSVGGIGDLFKARG